MANNTAARGGLKKATNVSVDRTLLEEARQMGINLSQALERELAREIREKQAQRWLAENRKAIEDYNARIEKKGVFSDGMRRF